MVTHPVMNGNVAALQARRIIQRRKATVEAPSDSAPQLPRQSTESELNDRNKSARFVGETLTQAEIARRLGWAE